MHSKEHTIFQLPNVPIASNGAISDSAFTARPQIMCEKSGLENRPRIKTDLAIKTRRLAKAMFPGRTQSWRFATVSKQASSEESLGTDMFEYRPEGVIVGRLKPGISDGEKGGPLYPVGRRLPIHPHQTAGTRRFVTAIYSW